MGTSRSGDSEREFLARQEEVAELGFDHSTDPDKEKCVICKTEVSRLYRTPAGSVCAHCAWQYNVEV